MLTEIHENQPGILNTKNLARSYVWWPSMDEDIENISKFCTSCQIHQNMPLKALIHPWENPQTTWMRIHLDFVRPYLRKMFLIISDFYSKLKIDIMPMNSINTATLTQYLRQLFSTQWLPFIIVTINGPSFTSNESKLFNEKKWNKTHFHCPLSPIV